MPGLPEHGGRVPDEGEAAGLGWMESSTLTDTVLETRLFPTKSLDDTIKRPEPDYEYIHNELRKYRKFNLTLIQVWLEYKEEHPDGYQYSQFCDRYRRRKGSKLDYYMRQEHRYGEKAK